MKGLRVCSRALLAVFLLLDRTGMPAHAADDPAALAMADIRPEAIRADMRFLADDLLEGRGAGTRGHEIAARFVAARFEADGLELGPFDTGDARWYGWLSEQLLQYGSERDTRTLLQNFVGRPVSPQALLNQIHRLTPATKQPGFAETK